MRDHRGRVVYIGITVRPEAREAEHRKEGKQFERLQVETSRTNRREAERWEAERLDHHRLTNGGHNPHYNKTRDGRYHW